MSTMKTILVVEDNLEFRESVVELLKEAGYNALEAAHGQEALDIMKVQHVDLVLSDIKMPVMDGLDLLKNIQALDENRPKVIMMTGYSIFTKEEALKTGAENMIEKTNLSETLVSILSNIRFY